MGHSVGSLSPALRRGLFPFVWVMLALGLHTPLLSAQEPVAPSFDAARDYIQEQMERFHIPSVAVAVALDGELVWSEGFGWADEAGGVRATDRTAYSVASVTKPITATAVLRLRDRGALDLDAPANRYLDGAVIRRPDGTRSRATVRQLLTHTAGLPLHHHFFYADDGLEPPPMPETIARYGVEALPPGEAHTYANLGYGILEYLASRTAELEFSELLEDEVFRPLGMTESWVGVPPEGAAAVAQRYGEDGLPLPDYDFDHRGASAVYSSARDLLRFGLHHLGRIQDDTDPALPDSTRVEMQRSWTPREGRGRAYGLGWAIVEDDGGYRRVEHTGGMPGVSTALRLYPEREAVVVVLSNSSNPATASIADVLAGTVLPNYLEERRRAAQAAPTVLLMSPSVLAGLWEGELHTWEGPFRLRLTISEDGTARLQLNPDGRALPVEPLQMRDGVLVGRVPLTIPTPDALRRPHGVHLQLWQRDEELVGFASALGWGGRNHFALSSPLHLRAVPDGKR